MLVFCLVLFSGGKVEASLQSRRGLMLKRQPVETRRNEDKLPRLIKHWRGCLALHGLETEDTVK